MFRLFQKLGMGVALMSVVFNATVAEAQMAPGAMQVAPAPTWAAPVAQPQVAAPVASPQGEDPGYVLLGEMTKPCTETTKVWLDKEHTRFFCEEPREALPANIGAGTPRVSRKYFMDNYPQMGQDGYRRIAGANKALCDNAFGLLGQLITIDEQFQSSEQEYAALTQLYESLPGDIKRGTKIMLISEAASTGALCIMTGGWYCLAAIVIGIANIFNTLVQKKLYLASIALSVANIRVTKSNMLLNRVSVRFNALWLDMAIPGCLSIYPDLASRMGGSFSNALEPLPPARPANSDSFQGEWKRVGLGGILPRDYRR